MHLAGPRVTLRQWTDADLDPLAAMNADTEVMAFFPNTFNAEQSRAFLQKQKTGIDERGWGLWAVEVGHEFAGLTGLAEPTFHAPFTPCVEIGWRFQRKFWGQGYALEAARVVLRFALANLRLAEVVSFTARQNARSQRLMQRLGMTHRSLEDFEHPLLPPGHPLRWHVLYSIRNSADLLDRLNHTLGARKEGT